jgi:hypothetical protein
LGDIVPNSVFDGGTAQVFNLNGNGQSPPQQFFTMAWMVRFNTFDPIDGHDNTCCTGMFVYSS